MLESVVYSNKRLYEAEYFPLNVRMNDNSKVDKYSKLLVDIGSKKDKKSFIELFEYFAPRVKSYLIGTGCTAEQAEEITQETMFNVWNKACSFDSNKALASTWIYTIARNKKIDALRKRKKSDPDMQDPRFVPEGDDIDEKIEKAESTAVISEAINGLPQEQSDIIYKNFFEDKSHGDIAKELDIPLGTVKSRIRLAMRKLREEIRKSNLQI